MYFDWTHILIIVNTIVLRARNKLVFYSFLFILFYFYYIYNDVIGWVQLASTKISKRMQFSLPDENVSFSLSWKKPAFYCSPNSNVSLANRPQRNFSPFAPYFSPFIDYSCNQWWEEKRPRTNLTECRARTPTHRLQCSLMWRDALTSSLSHSHCFSLTRQAGK